MLGTHKKKHVGHKKFPLEPIAKRMQICVKESGRMDFPQDSMAAPQDFPQDFPKPVLSWLLLIRVYVSTTHAMCLSMLWENDLLSSELLLVE